jgi:integrase
MPRLMHRLTEAQVRNARPREIVRPAPWEIIQPLGPVKLGRQVIPLGHDNQGGTPVTRNGKRVLVTIRPRLYPDGGNLALAVGGEIKNGELVVWKSWVFRYAIPGAKTSTGRQRERVMGLGPTHTVSLGDAREAARQARQLLLSGIDPLEFRRGQAIEAQLKAARAMTFDQARDSYITSRGSSWRSARHARDWKAQMERYVSPVFGHLPVTEIDTDLVCKALDPLFNGTGAKKITGVRIRGRIEQVLDYAATKGKRPPNEANPARWKGHLQHIYSAKTQVKHFDAVPWRDLPALWKQLEQIDTVVSKALRFMLLTATRTRTICQATWDEIDWDGKVWNAPPENMKTGVALRVPLTGAMLDILKSLPRDTKLIFPMSEASMRKLFKKHRPKETAHGTSRSTFADYASTHGWEPVLIDKALCHKPPKVTAAYQRDDLLERRRPMMEEYSRFATTGIDESANNVVLMRSAK